MRMTVALMTWRVTNPKRFDLPCAPQRRGAAEQTAEHSARRTTREVVACRRRMRVKKDLARRDRAKRHATKNFNKRWVKGNLKTQFKASDHLVAAQYAYAYSF